MTRLDVIVDGMFGSCGKGHLAAWLAQGYGEHRPSIGVRVAGPNAGHSVVGARGCDTSSTVAANLCERLDSRVVTNVQHRIVGERTRFVWRLRQVPVAAVSNPHSLLVIAAGSEIDPPVLVNEIECLDRAGYQVSERLFVDSSATVISDRHKQAERLGRHWDCGSPDGAATAEGLDALLGSTAKGVGAARADRLWRVPGVVLANDPDAVKLIEATGAVLADTAELLHRFLRSQVSGAVQVEGTQGYGLGLHARSASGELFYPYGTASDCRAIDFLAMAGINPWQLSAVDPHLSGGLFAPTAPTPALSVWVCLRPYPIRVGGNSGPMVGETSWSELGLEPELTTVTLKTRRVSAWDGELAARAIRANGGPGGCVQVALMMADQVIPSIAGLTRLVGLGAAEHEAAVRAELEPYEQDLGCPIALVGTGPDTILDLRT